jgi:hypothetical protein
MFRQTISTVEHKICLSEYNRKLGSHFTENTVIFQYEDQSANVFWGEIISGYYEDIETSKMSETQGLLMLKRLGATLLQSVIFFHGLL